MFLLLPVLRYDIYDSGGLCHFVSFLRHSANFLSVWFMCCLAMDMYFRTKEGCCKTLTKNSKARIIILALTAASTGKKSIA